MTPVCLRLTEESGATIVLLLYGIGVTYKRGADLLEIQPSCQVAKFDKQSVSKLEIYCRW